MGMSDQDPAQVAFVKLISEVRAELGPNASLNQIEAALLSRQGGFMRSLIQLLQQEAPPQEELSPPRASVET